MALGIRCLIQGVAKHLTGPVVVSLRWALLGVIDSCEQFNSKGVSDKLREHVAEGRWQRRVRVRRSKVAKDEDDIVLGFFATFTHGRAFSFKFVVMRICIGRTWVRASSPN